MLRSGRFGGTPILPGSLCEFKSNPSFILYIIMRKIEAQMIESVKNRQTMSVSNTQVFVSSSQAEFMCVKLYRTIIARVCDTYCEFTFGGFKTATTVSRIHQLTSNLCGYSIGIRKGVIHCREIATGDDYSWLFAQNDTVKLPRI